MKRRNFIKGTVFAVSGLCCGIFGLPKFRKVVRKEVGIMEKLEKAYEDGIKKFPNWQDDFYYYAIVVNKRDYEEVAAFCFVKDEWIGFAPQFNFRGIPIRNVRGMADQPPVMFPIVPKDLHTQ